MTCLRSSPPHPASDRVARVEVEPSDAAPHSVWLYLVGPDGILADCFLANLVVPVEHLPPTSERTSPPPVVRRFLVSDAPAEVPEPESLTFLWSPDGTSVALCLSGRPIGFIAAGRRRGYSRALCASCPWGEPWSPELFSSLFPGSR